MNNRLGMFILYSVAPVTFLLTTFGERVDELASALLLMHFAKRIFEVMFVHIYSAPIPIFTVLYLSATYISIALLFKVELSQELVADPGLRMLGVVMWVRGQLVNGWHHWLLRILRTNGRPCSGADGDDKRHYFVPEGGLFEFILFP